MELTAAINLFLRYSEFEKGLSEKTIRAYRSDLVQYLAFVHANDMPHTIEDSNKDLIRQYLQHLIRLHKPRTTRRKMASLRAMINFLELEDICDNNPFRKMRIKIKSGLELPRCIPQADITTLFKHVYRIVKLCHAGSQRYHELSRDIAVLELLFATGMRVSEMSSLQDTNINLQDGLIRVVGKGSRERTIPICCDLVMAALRTYLKTRVHGGASRGWFFLNRRGSRLSAQSIRFLVRKHARDAGIEYRLTPHMFRHTAATQLLRNGMDIRSIQRFLGHSSILTTQIYTHIDDPSQRRNVRRHHPRILMNVGYSMHDN